MVSNKGELTIDIFGIQNPTQQGADMLAAQLGARVAMPDFFKGKPWETSKFPPPDRDEFLAWIGATQWPQVEPMLLKTIGFLREDGAKKFGTPPIVNLTLEHLSHASCVSFPVLTSTGLYGFCWGGKMASQATKYVGAAAMVHPAFTEVSDAEKIVAPLALLDTKDEDKATMDKFIEEVKKKPFGDKVFRKRFDKTFHGFCAGRANYGDEGNAKYANEAYSDLATFFKNTL